VFIEAKDDGGDGGDNLTTAAISRAKLQSKHHHQQTNIQFLQARCPSCHPTNSVTSNCKVYEFRTHTQTHTHWQTPTHTNNTHR